MDWQTEDEDPEDRERPGEEPTFACPYCWQVVAPPLEHDLEGELVWDCEVCCKPWLIKITRDLEGARHIQVERAQD